ncbi:histidine phosphatase family protein [Lactococcus lactis]|uniref:Histidine phosphatase family protein n=1 Tax=Lactococcus lactis TaxID=1358 RepID=A0AAP5P4Y0_9LACT|nr:histidine phosphatase family protein [Lactococcus lactis]MDT2860332.1 histidine phosphatase family protein [Lactococcus lactis]MDT2862046.1 histidine phosphatase family protein [Lactococcus lactis]MDT2868273.1 histidine phosphatase family protein [Lactococcus lactis]MDT2869704.1 histidine phosphatase family protein [Lactococcus lactis]MDT2873622.1 histidine phosphatase family protein [Lactococcus lactis]
MLEIYLIRHGQTKWNLEKKMQGSLNSDLTVEGVEQAASLGKELNKHYFDHIYSSTSPRALETSRLIFGDKKKTSSDLLGEIAMGAWEGKTYQEIEKLAPLEWNNFFNHPFNYFPSKDGESFAQLEARLKVFIKEEGLRERSGKIAIVSHRITIRMLISLLLNNKELYGKMDLSSTSLSIIEIKNKKAKLKLLNSTAHYQYYRRNKIPIPIKTSR